MVAELLMELGCPEKFQRELLVSRRFASSQKGLKAVPAGNFLMEHHFTVVRSSSSMVAEGVTGNNIMYLYTMTKLFWYRNHG